MIKTERKKNMDQNKMFTGQVIRKISAVGGENL